MPEQALLVLEVKDELRYLFQAPGLEDVRGAGALLETLNRFTLPSLARQRDLQGAGIAGGGRQYVLTFAAPELAQRYLREARRIYRQRTVAAAVRGAAVAVQPEDLVLRFGAFLGRAKLAVEQEAPAAFTTVGTRGGAELRWCDRCLAFPASHLRAGVLRCRACHNRRLHLADQAERLALAGYQTSLADAGEEDLAARPVWERFLRWVRDRGLVRSSDAAADIGKIDRLRAPEEAAFAGDDGGTAIVVGQINDLDRTLGVLNDSHRTLLAAARVNTLLDDSLFEAAAAYCWRDVAQPLAWDPFVVGGDRFVAAFPSDRAAAVIARCLRSFEGQSAAAAEGRRLSLHVGVGFASAGLPLSIGAMAAQRGLEAARRQYVLASDGSARGAWRSTVGLALAEGDAFAVVNAGELERALAHARTLRRVGLDAVQLRPVAPAAVPGQARPAQLDAAALARATGSMSDAQRRTLTTVLRDLGVIAAEAAPADSRLLAATAALIPYAGSFPVLARQSSSPEAEPSAGGVEMRSA